MADQHAGSANNHAPPTKMLVAPALLHLVPGY